MRILILLLALSLSSCSVFARDADGVWVFEQGTVDGEPIAPVPDSQVTLEVSSGAISGNAGCNTYGIEADVYAGSFTLYPDREITEMACDPAVMETEGVYWRALQRTSLYTLEAETLELEGEDVFLTFRRAG